MEADLTVDCFSLMAGMVAVAEASLEQPTNQDLPASAKTRSAQSETDTVAEEEESLPEGRPAIWETLGWTPSLVDAMSQQLVRLRSFGFEWPWSCAVCTSTNHKFLGSCEFCRCSNESFVSAATNDIAAGSLTSRGSPSHILLALAHERGPSEIEACFALCEAMACESSSPREASTYYRHAFRLWSDLDSPLSPDGVPSRLRHEAETFLLKHGAQWKNTASIDTCSILGTHFCKWTVMLQQEESRPRILKTFDVEGIADYIVEQGVSRVVVMCGAGISTSAGIPDFRTPGTGLYDNLQKYKLTAPEDIFTLEHFRKEPAAFYDLLRELWPGSFAPTPCHHFIRLLHEKGMLLRCYTQNIDSLESLAGIPYDKLVAVHGNFDAAHVIDTQPEKLVDVAELKAAVEQGEEGWKALQACHGGLVKPKIVFFGESIPDRFCKLHANDLATCDLLLVLGTSLQVYPFSDLLSAANPATPRLLINRKPVGLCESLRNGFRFHIEGENGNWRDVFYEGGADEGTAALARALDWPSDLKSLISQASCDRVQCEG